MPIFEQNKVEGKIQCLISRLSSWLRAGEAMRLIYG